MENHLDTHNAHLFATVKLNGRSGMSNATYDSRSLSLQPLTVPGSTAMRLSLCLFFQTRCIAMPLFVPRYSRSLAVDMTCHHQLQIATKEPSSSISRGKQAAPASSHRRLHRVYKGLLPSNPFTKHIIARHSPRY